MLKKGFTVFLAALMLAGCNLPNRNVDPGTPTVDAIATEVSLLLTQMPTATLPAQATEAAAAAPSATELPATATVTATQTPQALPTLTPTVLTGDPKSALGEPAWRNTLDSGKQFYLFENEGTRVTAENGALVLTGLAPNGWLGWSLTFSKPMQNFYLEGVMNPQTCSGADQYGLVFRAPDTDKGYFYGFTCDGKYFLEARDFTDDSSLELIDTTANNAIQSGSNAVNRMGVMASGSRISLYANGILLEEVSDTTFSETGYFGAFVAAYATTNFTVRMDEIATWNLPGY